ncbi:MAG: phosphoribosyl-ATP diphosphatase [Alphaproteobacteria bacterium]|jgi:phosphoribosyl-ATP pyrophosphohydrolase|nr:phosphoribosyl-ATP diphosphatase [Alphaproteobacteria bacterium]PPR14087.1 MAG: Phosphoribosyl-ATP pyrophosphatase [Alphaproteobacteria bacterium MarineAlpha12_Bin1]|tara:strand:- start:3466 stop:3810 length:345 start_codon:yes stop_codon:yes gene_type:complete
MNKINSAFSIDRLFKIIESRKNAEPTESYTAKLLAGGTKLITKKVNEEAVETVEAALKEGPIAVTRESADLIYHLCVLWLDQGISPSDVLDELERREGTSGLVEKESRKKTTNK